MTEETTEKATAELERIIVKCGPIYPDYDGPTVVTRKNAKIGDQGYTFEFDAPLAGISTWAKLTGSPEKVQKGKLAKTNMHAETFFTPTVKEKIEEGLDIDTEEAIAEYIDGIRNSLEYSEKSVSKATKLADELAEAKAQIAAQDAKTKKLLGLAPDCSEEEYIEAQAKAFAEG